MRNDSLFHKKDSLCCYITRCRLKWAEFNVVATGDCSISARRYYRRFYEPTAQSTLALITADFMHRN